ncbi:MAG: hypothetical protein M1829_003573 [Trizodia sp. TS-e1964]|nr:MAG: hypothetical protein M1829_003573 [Trizodia sp. TS-e1964]
MNDLHKYRLLNVEEKPFKRITKRLLAPDSPLFVPSKLPPAPPPDGVDPAQQLASAAALGQQQSEQRRKWREDIQLDFAAFSSSVSRMQFLHNCNAKEREKYAAAKLRIQEAAQKVRENSVELREHLNEAEATVALRKTYDVLADKIISNRLLRTREEQQANLTKLNGEIADLERESLEYASTWAERREQFERIVKEGMEMRRLIRDEKEEVDRREGMAEQETEEGEEGEEGEVYTEKETASFMGTPRHDTGGATPHHIANENEDASFLNSRFGTTLTLGSRSLSRARLGSPMAPLSTASSPPRSSAKDDPDDSDAGMVEQGEIQEDGELMGYNEALAGFEGKGEGEDSEMALGYDEEERSQTPFGEKTSPRVRGKGESRYRVDSLAHTDYMDTS